MHNGCVLPYPIKAHHRCGIFIQPQLIKAHLMRDRCIMPSLIKVHHRCGICIFPSPIKVHLRRHDICVPPPLIKAHHKHCRCVRLSQLNSPLVQWMHSAFTNLCSHRHGGCVLHLLIKAHPKYGGCVMSSLIKAHFMHRK